MPTDAEGCLIGALKAIAMTLIEIMGALPANDPERRQETRRRTVLLTVFLTALVLVVIFWVSMR